MGLERRLKAVESILGIGNQPPEPPRVLVISAPGAGQPPPGLIELTRAALRPGEVYVGVWDGETLPSLAQYLLRFKPPDDES